MKKLILTLMLALGVAAGAQASEGGEVAWDKAPSRTNDLPALQNGAKLFVNYCLNCHSAAFMRFNRLQDIGLSEQQIKDNLLFVNDKVGETMKSPLDPKEAKEWFGSVPPDLTLIAQIGTLYYFGFFLLMPWWSRLGEFRPVPDRVVFSH